VNQQQRSASGVSNLLTAFNLTRIFPPHAEQFVASMSQLSAHHHHHSQQQQPAGRLATI